MQNRASNPVTFPVTNNGALTPHATWSGSIILVAFALGSYSTLPEVIGLPSTAAQHVAILTGIGLALSVVADYFAHGKRALFRADLACLSALYFLTLVEFLFDQPVFDETVTRSAVKDGLFIVVVGISVIALTRHMFPPRPALQSIDAEVPASFLLNLLIASAALGFLYRILSVDFNPVALIEAMIGPRFAVPWGRGRLGDWRALLSELELMQFLIPPLFASVWVRRRQLSTPQIWVAGFLFAFTLFSGFCGGTRNVFAIYIATFVVSYTLASPSRSIKGLLILGGVAGTVLMVACYFMLEFRVSGLKAFLTNQDNNPVEVRETLFIDYNLLAISDLTVVFPDTYDYLGMEVPYWAIVRPVPRALWPGKPEGLSVGIEDALDAEGFTIATTYTGEAYMAGGLVGVILASFFFGGIASWWNRALGGPRPVLISALYASGFFALAISMRSMLTFTTAILPTIALFVIIKAFPPTLHLQHNRRPALQPRSTRTNRTHEY